MAQAKLKAVPTKHGPNDKRPNGKAWKKSWGPTGPDENTQLIARAQSSNSKRKVK